MSRAQRTGIGRAVLVLVARLLPFGVLVALWALLEPREPYGTGDVAAIGVIVVACVLAFLVFDRLLRRAQAPAPPPR